MDSYDYLDNIEEPDEDELREIEALLNPEKLKSEYVDNITEDIDDTDKEPALEFSRSENGYRLVAIDKETSVSLPELIENKSVVSHLQNHGVFTVDDILRRTRRELSSYEFIGAKEADAMGEKLYYLGLTFADERIYKCKRCNAEFLGYKVKEENVLCPVCHMLKKNEKCTYYIKSFLPNDYKKEFNDIFSNIKSYAYDFDSEEIMIRYSSRAISAITAYQQVLEKYSMDKDDVLKWCFDIAIDHVREGREYTTDFFEMDYQSRALYVSEKYIMRAKKHLYDAVDVSYMVVDLVNTIYRHKDNYFNKELTKLLENEMYPTCKRYARRLPFISDVPLLLCQEECTLKSEDAIKAIILGVRYEMGQDGFKNILIKTANNKIESVLNSGDFDEFMKELKCRCSRIFVKEYNQFNAIKELSVFRAILDNEKNSNNSGVESCKKSIIDDLGLTETDAQYMAECIYEAFIMKKK